jgi:hypothetical protein
MVGDDPESFADLDGHTMTQTYQLANPAASSAWDPMGADSMSDMSGLTFEEASAMVAVEAAQADQQQLQQQQKTAANVHIKTEAYYATRDGLYVFLGATVSGSRYTDLNWIQTLTTSDADKPFIDKDPGQKSPFYLNPQEKKFMETRAKIMGYTTAFEDKPERGFKGKPVKWHADLKLVEIGKNGQYQTLKRISYGFTLDAKGVHLEDLTVHP